MQPHLLRAYDFVPLYDNVLNVGDVFSITNSTTLGAIFGSWYSEAKREKVSAAYFDRQMCTSPNAIQGYATRNPEAPMFTRDILGSALSGALDAGHWHFAEGRYPVPKGLENSPAGIIASMPVSLRNDGEANYENVNLVQTDFSVATDPQVSYTNKPADALIIAPDGSATIGDLSHYFTLTDTLTLTNNGYTRDIYLHFNGDSALTVDNLQDLRNLRDAVNNGSGTYKGYYSDNGFKDVAFVLTVDLDMDSIEWDPIGRRTVPFRGVFHGQNHTISRLFVNRYNTTANDTYNHIGLFGYMENASIDSLHLDNSCTVRGRYYVGGLVGYASHSYILGCSSSAKIISCYDYNGEIAGYICNNSTIDGCF